MIESLIANIRCLGVVRTLLASGFGSPIYLESLVANSPYLGIALVLLASGFGVPIPEDIPLVIGGYLCHLEKANIYVMLPIAMIAVLGADLTLYLLGRNYGQHIPRLPLIGRFLTPERLTKAQARFHKHGGKAIFIGRFLPGLRAPIFFTAGTFRITIWTFLFADGLAALISVPTLVLAGYFFGNYLDEVWRIAGRIELIIAALLITGVAGFIWYKRKKQHQ